MGESDRYSDYQPRRQRFTLGQPDNALMWLFAFNVMFFLMLLTIKTSISVGDNSDAHFYSNIAPWFFWPADFVKIGSRPWTFLTYMFSDIEVFRILSNMLWLWAFGSILQNLTGNKKLIPIYLYGGFAGALFFVLAANSIPTNKAVIESVNLLGANTAVMAIAVSVTMIAPNYRLFRHIRNGIPLWILTVVYVAIDLAGVADQPLAVPIAHVGGGLAGALFVVMLRNDKDGSVWMNKLYNKFVNLFNPEKSKKKVSVKEKVFYNTGTRSPYNKTANVTQQRVDEILDKISQKGFNLLTKEEKEILKRASES